MTPKKTPETNAMTQMNLLFCEAKPMILPRDKHQELATALADLLLNGATKPGETDEGGEQ